MFKILTVCLAAVAVAQDYTGTPFRWPDMLRNGGRVVQILSSETNPRPAQWNYPTWYSKYPMRFVQEIPTAPGGEVASGELVILEYDITDKMGLGKDTLQGAAKALGSIGAAFMNKFSPKHNELGLIAKDKTGKELGRYVFSLWPVGNDEIQDMNKDLRQKPREINGTQLITKNRAVTSVELSKANTWWGLPKDTKQIHVSNLNKEGYFKVLDAVKDYAEKHKYFNDYEITLPDGKVAMPAVTCNSLIEEVIEKATNQKAFDEGLGKMGYLSINLDKKKAAKFGAVPTAQVRELMHKKQLFNDHYNKDMYIVPAYYDPEGKAQPSATSETPDQWYVIWTSGVNWRQNYRKAEAFQLKQGIKSGADMGLNLRQMLDYEPVIGDVAPPVDAKAQVKVKGKGKKGKNMLKH